MNEHTHHEHHDTYREEVHTNLPRPTELSWGSIIAGVFAMLGVSWLLYLLGVAIGVSVADASDSLLLNSGLPEGVALWMLVAGGVAYFIGAALASRLSGTTDETVGMMHGLTLWGVATVVTVVLSYCGISSLLQTGQQFLATSAYTATSIASASAGAVSSGASGLTQGLATLEGTELANTIRNRLKTKVAEAVAAADVEGGAEVSEEEIKTAIENLDAETFDSLAAKLADGDKESAAELISEETKLTNPQANALIDGAYKKLEQRFGDPDNDTDLAGDLRQQMIDRGAEYLAAYDAEGEPEVDKQAISNALSDLNTQQMTNVASLLIQGKTSQASDLLVEETDLSSDEIDEILTGIQAKYEKKIEAVSEATNEAVERASTYAQQVLWVTFATSALGLAISVLGGWCGADASRRIFYDVKQVESTEHSS